MTNEELVDSLRKLADWYEQHPTLPVPYDFDNSAGMLVFLYGKTDEEVKDVLREIGSFEKSFDYPSPGDFAALKQIGQIKLRFHTQRETVCTPRVVGKRKIEEQVIPAIEEKVIPAHEVDIVEWDCGSVLEPLGLEGTQR